jgi:hypothetical protein
MSDLINNVTTAKDLFAALPNYITPNPEVAHDPDEDAWPDEQTLHPDDATYLKVRGVDASVAVARGYRSYYGGGDTRQYLPTGWEDCYAIIHHWKRRFNQHGKPADDGDHHNRALALPLFSMLMGAGPVLHQLKFAFPRIVTEGDGDKAKEKTLKFEVPSGTKRGSQWEELPADVHPCTQGIVEEGKGLLSVWLTPWL